MKFEHIRFLLFFFMFLQHETNQIEKAIKIKWALNICGGRSIQRSGFHIHLNTFLCILKSEKSKQHINLHYLGFADVCLKIEFMKIRKKTSIPNQSTFP